MDMFIIVLKSGSSQNDLYTVRGIFIPFTV